MFTQNSLSSRDTIKKRILKENLIPYVCKECGIKDNYNGKPIVLHLDHINGLRQDHRLENLRFLCPNCHSQTATYCGKSKNKRGNKHCQCGNEKYYYAIRCRKCNDSKRLGKNSKIVWPSIEELIKELKNSSYLAVARRLGVSDNAIRHHIMKRK